MLVPRRGGVEVGRAPGGGRTGRTGAQQPEGWKLLPWGYARCLSTCCASLRVGAEGWDVVAITGVETLVDGGWNVHLGREMAVCLIVIPG